MSLCCSLFEQHPHGIAVLCSICAVAAHRPTSAAGSRPTLSSTRSCIRLGAACPTLMALGQLVYPELLGPWGLDF